MIACRYVVCDVESDGCHFAFIASEILVLSRTAHDADGTIVEDVGCDGVGSGGTCRFLDVKSAVACFGYSDAFGEEKVCLPKGCVGCIVHAEGEGDLFAGSGNAVV